MNSLPNVPCSTLEGGEAAEHASCEITAQSFGGNCCWTFFQEKSSHLLVIKLLYKTLS
jgi:hypothetical protein